MLHICFHDVFQILSKVKFIYVMMSNAVCMNF